MTDGEPHTPSWVPTTPTPELDARLRVLAEKKREWIDVPASKRAELLRRCMVELSATARDWVEDGNRAKQVSSASPLAGEEWLAGLWPTMRNLRLFAEALEAGGQPRLPRVSVRRDGQAVVRVFPASLRDRFTLPGVTGEVWIEPGQPPSRGQTYIHPPPDRGKVALVLGAGNVSSIAPMDILYKLVVDDSVVVLKLHPVNAWLGPHLERAFAPLIAAGYVAVVYGGAPTGEHLVRHELVDTIHITGSDRTYDAIVWGDDPSQRDAPRIRGEPRNPRPVTAELGCVTPVLVVPGPWSAADMRAQARQVAGMVTQNAGFNCNAAKVLVTAAHWPQRETFLRMVDHELGKAPPRMAYYPGAFDRYQGLLRAYPRARVVGVSGEGVIPWTVLPDVPPRRGEYALDHEAFCGVLAEVALDARSPAEFLHKAVPFANDCCWGSLSCMLIIDPITLEEVGDEVDHAVSRLRYGGVAINCWAGLLYVLVCTTWGAYPGNTPEGIGSGVGVVHNGLLLDHPQKSVVRAPFRPVPKPAWSPDHRRLEGLGRALFDMEASPSWGGLAKVALHAVRG